MTWLCGTCSFTAKFKDYPVFITEVMYSWDEQKQQETERVVIECPFCKSEMEEQS